MGKMPLKVYKRRWPILAFYMMYMSSSAMQWCEYTIVNNLVEQYYRVSLQTIDWTFECFLLSYAIFCVPVLWIFDRLRLRKTLLIANTLLCVGALTKLCAVAPDRFYLLFIGQICQSVSQVFLYVTVFPFTASWFGANEISRAGAIAICGDVIGTGLGQILPTIFVPDTGNVDDIGEGLFTMNLVYSAIVVVCLILNISFFQSEPPTKPSSAQVYQSKRNRKQFLQQIKSAFSSPGYVLFLFSFSLCVGPLFALAALFNENYKVYFEGHIEYAGISAIIMFGTGTIGQVIGGYILDKTKSFKTVVISNACGCLASMILYTVMLQFGNRYLIYIISAIQGAFWLSFYGTGFQLAIELSYPVTEDISGGFVFMFNNIHALLITQIVSYIMRHVGPVSANVAICCSLALSIVLAAFIPSRRNRQEIEDVDLNEIEILSAAAEI